MGKFVSSLTGSFGDRMFQIASVWAQARKNGVKFGPHIMLTENIETSLSAGLRNLSPFLEESWPTPTDSEAHSGSMDKVMTQHPKDRYAFNDEMFSVSRHFRRKDDACLGFLGYFQNPRYFDHAQEDIRNWFETLPAPHVPALGQDMRATFSNAIGIDLYLAQDTKECAKQVDLTSYYREALAYALSRLNVQAPEKPLVVMCASNIPRAKAWALVHLKSELQSCRVVWFSRRLPIDALTLLGGCKFVIGGNSTFSWWAGFRRNHWGSVYLPHSAAWTEDDASFDLIPPGCNDLPV